MTYLEWNTDTPKLRKPVLIVAFEGWNDAGESATTAAKYIVEHLDAEKMTEINPDEFFDFTEIRPNIELNEDGRKISWPQNQFWSVQIPDADQDLLIFIGTEPNLKWRTYIDQIIQIIELFEVELIISLGALIAEVAHSRPSTLYSTSNDSSLIKKLNLEPSNYQGPTGIVGVLQNILHESDTDSLALWATIPSYVPHIQSPKAALAMITKITEITGIQIPVSVLELKTVAYEDQINQLIEEDEETKIYINEIETNYDSSMTPESGTELIEDLEKFLKERDQEDD